MATGFTWVYNLYGGAPTIQTFVVKDTIVFSKGELATADTGEVDSAATGDTTLLGATVEAVDNTSDGESVRVIVNPDAVYEVTDANARVAGANLDINTGALTVTTDSNSDLVVVETSTASEPTRVRITPTSHAFA